MKVPSANRKILPVIAGTLWAAVGLVLLGIYLLAYAVINTQGNYNDLRRFRGGDYPSFRIIQNCGKEYCPNLQFVSGQRTNLPVCFSKYSRVLHCTHHGCLWLFASPPADSKNIYCTCLCNDGTGAYFFQPKILQVFPLLIESSGIIAGNSPVKYAFPGMHLQIPALDIPPVFILLCR